VGENRADPNLRVRSLDSLRGLAALIVVVHHWRLAFFDDHLGKLVHLSPWQDPKPYLQYASHFLVPGGAAVMIFFVLSGFVLALSVDRPSETYGPFIIKRFLRIYPPFAVMVLLAALLCAWAGSSSIPQLSEWFNRAWKFDVNLSLLLGHLAMVGTAPYTSLDNVTWTLVHEMRISLVFPIIFYCVRRNLRLSLVFSLLLSVIAGVTSRFAPPVLASWLLTVYFSILFFAGAALAVHRAEVATWWRSRKVGTKVFLWCTAVLLLSVPTSGQIWTLYAVGLGAIGIVVFCFADLAVSAWLEQRPLLRLGRISYSLYLVHVPILLAVLHLGYGRFPTWLLIGTGLALAFLAAEVMNRVVELPSQKLGRTLAELYQGAGPRSLLARACKQTKNPSE